MTLENEPVIEMRGSPESIIMYETPDGEWVICDTEENITTQAKSKPAALLMLADALVAYNEVDIDLLSEAEEIFTLTEEQEALHDELTVGDEPVTES